MNKEQRFDSLSPLKLTLLGFPVYVVASSGSLPERRFSRTV
ncbi:MAG: hypothetical protein JWO45_1563 [Spartobacteria bacterium]|nr:hypothetical protein [Spartobacteria bacterium]